MVAQEVGDLVGKLARRGRPLRVRTACAQRGDGFAQVPPRLIEGVLGQRHLEPGIARLAGGARLARPRPRPGRLLQRAPMLVAGELGLEPGARLLRAKSTRPLPRRRPRKSSCPSVVGKSPRPKSAFLARTPSGTVHLSFVQPLRRRLSKYRSPRYTRLPAAALRARGPQASRRAAESAPRVRRAVAQRGSSPAGAGAIPWSGQCCFAS